MEDDHVDRPGVEVRQRMKLTGTNSSIGLIIHIARTHPAELDGWFSLTRRIAFLRNAGAPRGRRISADARSCLRASPEARANQRPRKDKVQRGRAAHTALLPYSPTPLKPQLLIIHAFCRPGGSGGVAAPVPIPNTAVKRPSADGTSSQDAGE